jgi:hypothetical protein
MNRRTSRSRRRNDRFVTTAVAVLGVLVFACVGMLIPPMWEAVVDVWQFRHEAQECRPLKDTKARQRCNQPSEHVERVVPGDATADRR